MLLMYFPANAADPYPAQWEPACKLTRRLFRLYVYMHV